MASDPGREQQQDERLGGRIDDHPPDGRPLAGLQRIRANGECPSLGLVAAQADGRIDSEAERDVVDGQRMGVDEVERGRVRHGSIVSPIELPGTGRTSPVQ